MATEALNKFDPRRTMHLRGFDRRGAAAALHSTTASGFTVSGVFRSADDFAVLVLHDADNRFEHHDIRYLPDGDLTGMVLEFDVSYSGLQPLDSPKFQSIPWGSLSYLPMIGASQTVQLFEGPAGVTAGRVSGAYTAASGAFTFEDNGIQAFDRVTLWYLNVAFDHIVPNPPSADPLGAAIDDLVAQINSVDWSSIAQPLALRAVRLGSQIELTAARYGLVDINDRTLTWTSGQKFAGLEASDSIQVAGTNYLIESVASKEELTLTVAPGAPSGSAYLADRGGIDGNMVRLYRLAKNANFTTTEETVALSGGDSSATWRIGIDFSALGIDQLRQCWLTLAPQLADSAEYGDTEWDATFTNLTVTDPNTRRPLKIAGPGSVRLNSADRNFEYLGAGWQDRFGFHDSGRARVSASSVGDAVQVRYQCGSVHDLYLGTELGPVGGTIAASLDGDAATGHTTQLFVEPPVVSLIKLRTAVPAGEHSLLVSSDGNGVVLIDHVVAAVASDVPDPAVSYTDRSAATDYDTDATYKIAPQRLVWQLDRLGFGGDVNHFEGNFFHYQRRKRASTGLRSEYKATFTGPWATNDALFLSVDGIDLGKSVFPADDGTSIARHFAFFVNETFVGLLAEGSGNVLTIRPRANLQGFGVSVRVDVGSGVVGESGDARKGTEGVWEIDDQATQKLNYGARRWLEDFFGEIGTAGLTTTVAYNLEGYNPPETASARWAARYLSGRPVRTSVGFGSEAEGRVVSMTDAAPPVLEVPGHGYETGDEVTLNFAPAGSPPAGGAWTITVIDPDRFSLDGATGKGDYVADPVAPNPEPVARRALKTTHLAPNAPVTDFLKAVFAETAALQAAAGLTPRLQLGEQLWWFFSDASRDPVASATATAPIVLWLGGHGMSTGETMIVAGVRDVPQANGTWTVTALDGDRVSLDGSDGTPAPADASAQGRAVFGSMGFYDEDTKTAAQTALGRALASFQTQDDDPAVNAGVDADFLRDRLEDHLEAIVSHVRTTHPTAIFELLYPFDVLHPDVYHTLDLPFPQGGRLNHHVSTPPVWLTQADTDRRLKVEALSWGAFYRDLGRAKEAIELWNGHAGFNWPRSATTYLLPWFNGGTPWRREYLLALAHGPDHVVFWAHDHKKLLEWPGLPKPGRRSRHQGR